MRLLFQGTVPKVLAYPGDNEDAAAVDEARGRIALSDGASESYDSKTWSNLLVKHFVRDPRVGPGWVRRSVAEFAGRVDRDQLSWSKQASFDRGSFATLLGIRWDPSSAVVDCWCIGDSLIALLDGGDLVECLPYTDPSDFQRRPQLLSTSHSLNAFVSKSTFRRNLHHQWRVDGLHTPLLICMTDGIAEWALRESESRPGVWGQLARVARDEELAHLVTSERAAHNMRVDDVTLVTVGLDLEPAA